ncbi:hypothetical protein NL676_039835 [Syzygium grande]|nr:hypothetical protein NL676_039835 [Syzygium grande]
MADSVFDGLSHPNLFPHTAVVSGLGKADPRLEAAVEAFFRLMSSAMGTFHIMPEKNCVSRNALLAGFCVNGKAFAVLDLFISMVGEGSELTDHTLTTVAKACGLLRTGKLCEKLQGFIIEFSLLANACVEAASLDMCTHCGRTVDAGKMLTHAVSVFRVNKCSLKFLKASQSLSVAELNLDRTRFFRRQHLWKPAGDNKMEFNSCLLQNKRHSALPMLPERKT